MTQPLGAPSPPAAAATQNEPDYLGRVVVLFVVALAMVLTMGAVALSL